MENSPDNMSVLLQFAKFSKGYRISDFDEFVQEYIGFENLDFFGRLAYPNQWQIRLTDPSIRERLIRTGRTRIKNRSCWMYPLNQQEIRGFVQWLPNSVTNDQLTRQLQLYGDVLFVESEERMINGGKVESDRRYYGLILPYGTIKEDLPHFLKINGYLCLVVVRGREPACYHCREVGHRRAECPKYKAKLISYCNREQNIASRRLKPRGRRHVKEETEVIAEASRKEVSSNDNEACLEKEILVESVTELHLSASNNREHVEAQGKAIGSIEKEFMERDFTAQRKANSCTESSGASFSEIQTKCILETIQHIQQETKEDLHQMLKSAEKEIALILTMELSTHTRGQGQSTAIEASSKNLEQVIRSEEMYTKEANVPQDSTTPVETTETDSNIDAVIEETKSFEIGFDVPTMHQVKLNTAEKSYNNSEEKSEYLQSNDKDSISNASTKSSVLLMLKETKQAASDNFKSTFQTLGEFAEEIKAPENPSKDIATDLDSKLSKESAQDLIGMLVQAKEIAAGHSGEIFKKIETSILSDLSGESIDTEARFTEDDIHFARQMLEKTKENATGILQNTFKILGEFAEEIKGPEEHSNNSATEVDSKFTEDVAQDLLGMLEKTKAIVARHFGETFKKIDTGILTDLSEQSIDTEARFTEDDIYFAGQMLAKTKENATGILQNTFKILGEFAEEIKASEKHSNDSATEVDSKLTEEGAHDLLGIVKQAKEIAAEHSEELFKKLETGILSDLSGQSVDSEARFTEDDIHFSRLMLAKTKENATGILQNTFKKLEESAVKQSSTTTESADESKPLPKVSNITTQHNDTLQKLKQDVLYNVKHICTKDMMVVEAENSENTSSFDESSKDVIRTKSDPVTIVRGDIETEVFKRSEESIKRTVTEMTISERKEMKYNIYKVIQEDMDKLIMNLRKIFDSVQQKIELFQTSTLLKQVELDVIEVIEETKNKWQMDMENI